MLPAPVDKGLGELDSPVERTVRGHVVKVLAQVGVERSMSRVLTGAHESYYQLIAQDRYGRAAELDDGTFCVYANTPRSFRKSYLRYLRQLGLDIEF